MEITMIGYALALIIGCIMGLLGAGGSLIYPVLVYLLSKDAMLSTTYALFLVGITATIGIGKKISDKEVDFKIGLLVAIPTMLGTLLDRLYLLHIIPDTLFSIGDYELGKTAFLMIFFALLLVLSSLSMLGVLNRGLKDKDPAQKEKLNYPLIVALSFAIGVFTGLLGAGGGVLVVPMLVLVVGVPIRLAIGTSLFVVAFKSVFSFLLGDLLMMGGSIEWTFLFGLSACMVIGILSGNRISKFVEGGKLKRSLEFFYYLCLDLFCLKEMVLV